MKIDCILTACNLNPKYLQFIEYFIRAWRIVLDNIDIKIILISNKIPDFLIHLQKHIILFSPIPNVSDIFISQYIRLLYPSILKYFNGVLITDIDMIPMNKNYYTNNICYSPNNSFICYRDELIEEYSQISMCYCIANSNTWGELFGITNIEDIIQTLINNYDEDWCRDQIDLYTHVKQFKQKYPTRTIILKRSFNGIS